ncbi:uncharacterized protein [Littorina saxatilis]|uniref:uncharacterized protein n=1 Tax=Littorina saxatilis TaxID=31220 RepID=UPI0038B41F22
MVSITPDKHVTDNGSVKYSIHHAIDYTHPTAYLAVGGTLIVLTFLLNVSAIAVIVYLYVKRKRPTVTNQSPRFIPMLACCVAEILQGVWDSAYFNMLRVRAYEGPYSLTCREEIGLILSTLPLLLVAAVIVTQAVRFQRVVTLTRRVQKVVAVVMVAISVLYVVVVVTPVFYVTFVDDNTKECVELDNFSGKEYVNYQQKKATRRVQHAVDYIVPSLLVLLACLLLLLAHVIRRNNNTGTSAPPVATGPTSPSPEVTPSFPFNVLLAAASSLTFYFLFFLFLFKDFGFGLTQDTLWLAGITLLKLNGVCLPCFWLLDADIRALWCCCENSLRAPPEVVALGSAERTRVDNDKDTMNKTRK